MQLLSSMIDAAVEYVEFYLYIELRYNKFILEYAIKNLNFEL